MNKDTISFILKQSGCTANDAKITSRKDMNNDIFDNTLFHNKICFKGTPNKGHYVYVDETGKPFGTYESKLIDEKDDGICHGAAINYALLSCGSIRVDNLISNPKSELDKNENYKIIMNLYKLIIENGWWDKALATYFYNDVTWDNTTTTTTIQTQNALQCINNFLAHI